MLDQIGVDPAGIGGVLDALVAAGVPQEKIIGISQGWKLGGAIKTTEQARRGRVGARRSADDGLVLRECPRRAARELNFDHETGIRVRKN
ncbi:hypothetical protein AUC61_13980 [Pseudomonas sp. S25]|uniref:Uncharacterized protein n=1 Tax=Pseudomonas maioricensis TaxID=1766623 RepID=A0ABS9ZJA2_9PSED|nr:hypothetical protein [Pseudomonas sp. S25]